MPPDLPCRRTRLVRGPAAQDPSVDAEYEEFGGVDEGPSVGRARGRSAALSSAGKQDRAVTGHLLT